MDDARDALCTESGFSEAVLGHERLMYSVSFALLNDRELCSDVVQSAILKAWKRIGTLRDPEKFRSWLIRILINECRSMKRRPAPLPLDEDIPAESEDSEMKLDVRRAVMKLDEKQRVPVVLYYFEDMPVERIAAVLGVPKGTVLSRLSRARDTLRKELRELEDRRI